MNKIIFSVKRLDTLPTSEKRMLYHDQHQQGSGLKLRVTPTGKKSFMVIRKLNGKTRDITLGSYPAMTIEQARTKAREVLNQMSEGIDPNAKKKADRARGITLNDAIDGYITSHNQLKPRSIEKYLALKNHLKTWGKTPLLDISRDMVERKHRTIGETTPVQANNVMKALGSIFSYAMGQYENEQGEPIILHNPITRLNHIKAWFPEQRKQSYIKPADMKTWFEAVSTLSAWNGSPNNEVVRDYLLVVLFTGLRRREADRIKWDHINFKERTLYIPITKNGHPHTLPLSDYLYDLFESRTGNNSEFVFQGAGKSGHLAEPKRVIKKVAEYSGIPFTLHDLRRTFLTIAESIGIREYALKRLVNHISKADVTEGYIILDIDRLREPMQAITNKILNVALPEQTSNVIPINAVV
ncbi:MAG: integrase family protein [gamma proteobacterium symbiont of Taylorina sp.]|nr:integrase family protein [gamma proteobacterium symbiont of Taylorina sp.]